MAYDPIEYARQLMNSGRYDEARQVLMPYANDPRAYGLLQTLDAMQQGGDFKRKNDQMYGGEPYQGGYQAYQQGGYPMQQQPPMYGGYPPQQPPMYGGFAPTKSYTGIAVGVLVLYVVFWIAGLVVNIIMINEANSNKRNPYMRVEGDGCLTALLWVFGILPFVLGCGWLFLVMMLGSSLTFGGY